MLDQYLNRMMIIDRRKQELSLECIHVHTEVDLMIIQFVVVVELLGHKHPLESVLR